jgi:WD40 repeat protein
MGKGPIFVSNSKINSLLSSLTKLNRSSEKYEQLNEYSVQEKPFLKPKTDTLLLKIVDSKPIAAVEDPNHTHVILACKDHTIRIYNTCTRKTNLIGKHARQVTALSNITFERQRVFFSGSRDSVIKQWVCDSIHGNYRQEQQFRLKAPALKLILDRSYLCIITASEILRRSTESNTFVSRTEIKGQYRTAL